MIKELALIVGGAWLFSKISETKTDSSLVVPAEKYDSILDMWGTDLKITLDKFLDRISLIADPIIREDTVSQLSGWIKSGLTELQINDLIDQAINFVDTIFESGGSIMTALDETPNAGAAEYVQADSTYTPTIEERKEIITVVQPSFPTPDIKPISETVEPISAFPQVQPSPFPTSTIPSIVEIPPELQQYFSTIPFSTIRGFNL